jgi:hypothetical protein
MKSGFGRKTLTQEDIKENMFRIVEPDTDGLLAYYNFDEKVGDIISDQSENNYHGTLLNMDNYAWAVSHAWQRRESTPNLDPIDIAAGYLYDSLNPYIQIIAPPHYGEISFSSDSMKMTYTPTEEFYGWDSVYYVLMHKQKKIKYKIYIKGTLLFGSSEEKDKNKVSVYPQPASYYFIIENDSEIESLEIFNIKGELVFSSQNLSSERIYFDVRANNLTPGFYLIKMISGNQLHSKKILISGN